MAECIRNVFVSVSVPSRAALSLSSTFPFLSCFTIEALLWGVAEGDILILGLPTKIQIVILR